MELELHHFARSGVQVPAQVAEQTARQARLARAVAVAHARRPLDALVGAHVVDQCHEAVVENGKVLAENLLGTGRSRALAGHRGDRNTDRPASEGASGTWPLERPRKSLLHRRLMRICLLGATGLVGRESLDLVARAWPGATLSLYASRDQELKHGDKTYKVEGAPRLEDETAPKGDLAFVALDDDHSKRYVPRLLALGYRVIDKSNTYRADPKVPLVAAGVNSVRIDETVRLVANPNCTTIPLTLALSPLQKEFGLEDVTVSTYQAVSGAGIAALDGFLEASKTGYQALDRLGSGFDPKAYAGNTVPHNGGTDDSGFSSEERKLMFEAKKILELPELGVSAQCCRVGVAVGHYENAWVTFGSKRCHSSASPSCSPTRPSLRSSASCPARRAKACRRCTRSKTATMHWSGGCVRTRATRAVAPCV